MAASEPDLVVLAGDYCGSFHGGRDTAWTFRAMREVWRGPIVAVLGNHDYWEQGNQSGSRPSLHEWVEGYRRIVEAKEETGIHLFESDGIYRQDGWTFLGHGLWYGTREHISISNDYRHIPFDVEGNTYGYFNQKWSRAMDVQMLGITEDDINLGFISHFPVVDLDDSAWCGPKFLGERLLEIGVEVFINGHTHGNMNGPRRFECGADYGMPRYRIVSI